MSAGHPHHRPHTKTAADLDRVLRLADTPAMMARPARLVLSNDIPDTGGYSVDGLYRFLDRDFARLLRSGQITVPGMTPDQIMHAILLHEQVEKSLIDGDNGIDDYLTAHEYATVAEHRFVSQYTKPRLYEGGIRPAIIRIEHKVVTAPPRNLSCAPYLDAPDENDRRVLTEMHRLGVLDASKANKPSVKYGDGHPDSKCGICVHLQRLPNQPTLSSCGKVEGTVHLSKWCNKFRKYDHHAHARWRTRAQPLKVAA